MKKIILMIININFNSILVMWSTLQKKEQLNKCVQNNKNNDLTTGWKYYFLPLYVYLCKQKGLIKANIGY